MKRRSFLQLFLGLFGIGAVPAASAAAPAVRDEFRAIEAGFDKLSALAAPEEFPFVLVHHVGGHPCHQPAYLMRRRLKYGELVRLADFAHLDRSPARSGERIACGTCGGLVAVASANIEPANGRG